MRFTSNFIYNDGAAEGAGDNLTATLERPADENVNDNAPVIEKQDAPAIEAPLLTAEELKNYGFDSKEQLKEFLAKQKELSVPDEEKQKKLNVEKAEFLKHAADNGISLDDISKYESLQAKNNLDLVWERYLAEEKEDNPELTEQEIKDNFDIEYRTKSENAKEKERFQKKIEKEANELRSPYKASFDKAQSSFKEEKDIRTKYPEYQKVIDKVIKDNTPDKLTVFKTKDGEEEVDVDLELTKEQKEEVAKMFNNPKSFQQYLNSGDKVSDFEKKVAKKIEGFIKVNNFDAAVQKSYEKGMGIGTKKGSTVGAENLFALNQSTSNEFSNITTLEESNAKIAAARARTK